MQFRFVLALCTVLTLFGCLCFAQNPPSKAPVKVTLTKIQATGSIGLCFALTSNSLQLRDVTGDIATSFPIDPATLKVTPSVTAVFQNVKKVRKYTAASQTWMLEDSTREGVKITNNTIRSLSIISEIDRSVTLRYGGELFSVPPHSLFILNQPSGTGTLDMGDNWVAYYGDFHEALPTIKSPTLIVLKPNIEGIENGLPEIDEGTIFDQTLNLGVLND